MDRKPRAGLGLSRRRRHEPKQPHRQTGAPERFRKTLSTTLALFIPDQHASRQKPILKSADFEGFRHTNGLVYLP
jgi:hypothetical protein